MPRPLTPPANPDSVIVRSVPAPNKSDRDVAVSGLHARALRVCALVLFGVRSFFKWNDSTRTILTYADNAICGLFFIDFTTSFFQAPSKWRYFRTWGWIDLL